MAVIALGAPRWDFFRRRKAPRALLERCSALAARRKRLAAARLPLALVFELMTLPPVMRLLGLSPSQDAKCLALGHFVISVPISLMTFSAVKPSTPSIRVRSTPGHPVQLALDVESGARSSDCAFCHWEPEVSPSLRSSNRSNRASISRSHSAILA